MSETLKREQIERLNQQKVFEDIDIHFAKFILELAKTDNPVLLFISALASYAVHQNHVCADLHRVCGKPFPQITESDDILQIIVPEYSEIEQSCQKYPKLISDGKTRTPLVLKNKRLYLYKYYNFEKQLAEFIRSKNSNQNSMSKIPFSEVQNISSRFTQTHEQTDWQQIAVYSAIVNNFTIITGAPGTGKTSVVATILALLIDKFPDRTISICAPTGKAAARLKESIQDELQWLKINNELKSKILDLSPATIHRMLGVIYHTPHFKHNRENPLNTDVLILDEASMVSLPLMVRLFQALPEYCKIILLGDKNQLSSVESGAVFGDLCDLAAINEFTPDFIETTQISLPVYKSTALFPNSVVELQKSYRFNDTQGIGKLTSMINRIESTTILGEIQNFVNTGTEELIIKALPASKFATSLVDFVQNMELNIDGKTIHYTDYMNEPDIARAYRIMSEFRILCAHRNGKTGANNINKILVNRLLALTGDTHRLPENLPVMITENDSHLDIYNGDIGLVRSDELGQKQIWFPDNSNPGGFRKIIPAQLPAWEPGFAITIHKSQGSGFQKILVMLPGQDSPILTRELIYTGITRAKNYCEVWSDSRIFINAVQRKTERVSGLKEQLSE